jgi:hypothetical protein
MSILLVRWWGVVACAIGVMLSGCGTLTGLPSHGGGKRFAIEQQLIAQSARATVKNLDVTALKGKKVVLRVSAIGDQGAGNLTGGRYSIEALVRGMYVNTPTTSTDNELPLRPTTATTTSGDLTSTTVAESIVNEPTHSESSAQGIDSQAGGGVRVQGMGDYTNSTLITNPGDLTYLLNVIQTYFYLKGIDIVTPDLADTAVFVTVDIFGTIRSRDDVVILNNESLVAQTSLEMMAVDIATGQVVIRPQSYSYESRYKEEFVLWSGPVKRTFSVQPAEPMLVTFADVDGQSGSTTTHALSTFGTTSSEQQSTAVSEDDVKRVIEAKKDATLTSPRQ